MILTNIMSSIFSIFLSPNFLLFLFLFSYFANKGYSLEGKDTTDLNLDDVRHTHQYVVHISSLLPSNICSPLTHEATNFKKASLKIVHKHGPCSQANNKHDGHDNNMSPADIAKLILERDQYRVNSIQSSVLLKRKKKRNTDHAGSSLWSIADHHSTAAASTLPAYTSAKTIDAGNYVVPVGIGSPKTQVSLAFDTLSSLTWTQCQPCAGRCFKQSEPIFEPNESFTYANISCSSQVCSDVERTTGRSSKCDISTCVYVMSYADQVFSAGYLARERLTLSSDVFNSFLLGCGQSNGGFTEGLSGVLGLGRDKLSIVSQTARKYESIFSYCLPSSTSLTGFLSFGVTNVKRLRNVVKFTPLISNTRFYGVDMTGISVGGRDLQISRSVFSRSGGMAIDPVTAITRLPPRAYQLLRSEFRQALSSVYPEAPGTSLLDTCFDLRRYRGNTVPKIRFYFDGDVEVELDFSAIFFLVNNDASRACLAFAATDRDTDFAIFGNMQQRTVEVVFDVPGERVGFGASGCK